MQQKLAVASVLVLVLLAGTSAVLIFQSHVTGQAQPNGASQNTQTTTSSMTHTSANSTAGSLLASGNQTRYDGGGTRPTNGTMDE